MKEHQLSLSDKARTYSATIQRCIDAHQFATPALGPVLGEEVKKELGHAIDSLLKVTDITIMNFTLNNGEQVRAIFAGGTRPDGTYGASRGEFGQITLAYHHGEQIRLSQRINFSEIDTVNVITLGDPLQFNTRIAQAESAVTYAHKSFARYGHKVTGPQMDALRNPAVIADTYAKEEPPLLKPNIPDGVPAGLLEYELALRR